jgi:hypothetical protein
MYASLHTVNKDKNMDGAVSSVSIETWYCPEKIKGKRSNNNIQNNTQQTKGYRNPNEAMTRKPKYLHCTGTLT